MKSMKSMQFLDGSKHWRFLMNANNGKSGDSTTDLGSRPRIGRSGKALCLGLLFGLSCVGVAVADDDGDSDAQRATNGQASDWKVGIGLGAINVPRYPGSRNDYRHVVPAISLGYGRFFLGGLPGGASTLGLGAYLARTEHFQFGVSVGGEVRKPREASDDPILRGWGDIARTERGAAFANYNIDWFNVHGYVSTDIGGKHEGTIASLSFDGRIHPLPKLTLSAGPEVLWGDSKYTQTFFAISAAQAAIADTSPYVVKSGINMVRFGVGADYFLTQHWMLGAHVAYGKLQGDAVRTRTDPAIFPASAGGSCAGLTTRDPEQRNSNGVAPVDRSAHVRAGSRCGRPHCGWIETLGRTHDSLDPRDRSGQKRTDAQAAVPNALRRA
jgi:outer membrane protein